MARQPRYTDDQLKEAVAKSRSILEVLPQLGLSKSGGNHALVKRRIAKLGINTSHLLGRLHMRGRRNTWSFNRPFEEILVMNSTYTNSSSLKIRLIKAGLLINKCSICGQPPEWNGKPLVLVLDHINGDRENNRIENLRIICRHCDSQLPTFAGRNSKQKRTIDDAKLLADMKVSGILCAMEKHLVPRKYIAKILRTNGLRMERGGDKVIPYGAHSKEKHPCRICGLPTRRQLCYRCAMKKRRKVERPSKEQLIDDLECNSILATGKKYGVTDNAVRKWCIAYEIPI